MSFLNTPNVQDDGQDNVTIQKTDTGAANLIVTGNTKINQGLNVTGKTSINSQADNLPLEVIGAGGQFWLYSSGGQNNGAVIRGGTQSQYGIVFTGTDRVRIEGVGGDNRAATLGDFIRKTYDTFAMQAISYGDNNWVVTIGGGTLSSTISGNIVSYTLDINKAFGITGKGSYWVGVAGIECMGATRNIRRNAVYLGGNILT
ncbi:MAG: hypothetical protein ACK5Z5_02670, partial [Neisseriaceae bacterium]